MIKLLEFSLRFPTYRFDCEQCGQRYNGVRLVEPKITRAGHVYYDDDGSAWIKRRYEIFSVENK